MTHQHAPVRRTGNPQQGEYTDYIDITETVESPWKQKFGKHFAKHWLKWILGTIGVIALLLVIIFWRDLFNRFGSSEKTKNETPKEENAQPIKKGGKTITPDFMWDAGENSILLAPGESASIGIKDQTKGQVNITGPVSICDLTGNNCTDEVPDVFNNPDEVRLGRDRIPFLVTNTGEKDVVISCNSHRVPTSSK